MRTSWGAAAWSSSGTSDSRPETQVDSRGLGAPGIPPPRATVYRLSHVRISTVGHEAEDYPTSAIRQDLTRTTLAVICILLLIAGSLWILLPFLAATVWATMLVVATWPILESLQRRLGNRRAPAVAVMTLGLLLLLVIPLWGAIQTIAEHAQEVTDLAKKLAESGLPQPPDWVGKLPLVGKKLSETLSAWANAGPAGLEAKLGPYVSAAALWVFNQAGSLGGTLVQFL